MGDFLDKIPPDDRRKIAEVSALILMGKLDNLDIKKLQGYEDLFRVRVGRYRIICKLVKKHGFVIVKVTGRNDTTYNF